MDEEAVGGIDQAHDEILILQNYVKTLEDYQENLLLVGINHNKEKKHSCVIEKMEL